MVTQTALVKFSGSQTNDRDVREIYLKEEEDGVEGVWTGWGDRWACICIHVTVLKNKFS